MDLLEQHAESVYMEGVHAFLKSTWSNEEEPRYRVYMAQKCLNLNEYYFIQEFCPEHNSNKNKENDFADVRKKTFISQYALLLKADELVDYYTAHKEFPHIDVVDELILTGHDFSSLMYRMLDVIFDAWQSKYGEIGQKEYWVIRDAFIKSVSYRVCARSKDVPLLDQSLPRISGNPFVLDKSQWSKYTADIVKLLNETTTVENTSFIPSLWLSKTQYENIFHSFNEYLFGWNSTVWQYGKTQAEIWQKDLVGTGTNVRLHLVFACTRKRTETNQEDIVCVTPYVFWGKLQEPALDKLFTDIADVLRRQESTLSPLAEICMVPYRAATNSKLRFLYALICIIELSELTQTPINTLRNDLEKVVQSFGTIEQIYPALEKLCIEEFEIVRKELRAIIYHAMWDAPALDPDAAIPENGGTFDQVGCLKAAEEYFIHVDRLESQQTKIRRDEKRTFIPSSNFFYVGGCLSRYFKHLSNHYTLNEKVAALVLQAQNNVVTLTISAQGDDAIYAKVGEATAGAAWYADYSIRRMSVYIPALVVLERVCKKMNLTMKYWAELFGAFLEKNGAEEGLEQRFRVFVEGVYNSGYSMEDYRHVKGNERDPDQAELYRRQVYYQEQVAVFFRES